jgi:hypothetical protein
MDERINQMRTKFRTLSVKEIHPLKWIAYLSGVRSGAIMRRRGMPHWVGEHECVERIDEEEHWWWIQGFDVGYHNRNPVEELSNLLKPKQQ